MSTAANYPHPSGSEHAYTFRELYSATGGDVWHYCLRRSTSVDQAEDALAATFETAWQQIMIVPTGAGTKPWLFRVAHDYLRADKTHRNPARPLAPTHDQSQVIRDALGRLPEYDREILRLVTWEKLTQAEMAHVLDCPQGEVERHLDRSRKRLKRELERKGIKL